jgi:hypothetical protein
MNRCLSTGNLSIGDRVLGAIRGEARTRGIAPKLISR